jgi:hypothetical protein
LESPKVCAASNRTAGTSVLERNAIALTRATDPKEAFPGDDKREKPEEILQH